MSSESTVAGDHGRPTSSDLASTEATQLLREDPSTATTGHKRSLSGSLLSRLSFLRTTPDARNGSMENIAIDSTSSGVQIRQNGITGGATQKKGRSRKGSLRKTALLGTGKLRMEKRSPGLETIVSPRLDTSVSSSTDSSHLQLSPDSDDFPTPRASYEKNSTVYATINGAKQAQHLGQNISSDENLAISGLGDMSTTDDEDLLNQPRGGALSNGATGLKQMPDNSYFSLEGPGGILRRRSSKKTKSPLATMPVETIVTPEEWDYSETEWWGWVVLIVTWIVFVVGMGSCFEVWSWAWDVGETPYAPPELEDDPTLPIVGYYPALIILTGVMAWVWVVVAWVGMKYFKHAKIPGENL